MGLSGSLLWYDAGRKWNIITHQSLNSPLRLCFKLAFVYNAQVKKLKEHGLLRTSAYTQCWPETGLENDRIAVSGTRAHPNSWRTSIIGNRGVHNLACRRNAFWAVRSFISPCTGIARRRRILHASVPLRNHHRFFNHLRAFVLISSSREIVTVLLTIEILSMMSGHLHD